MQPILSYVLNEKLALFGNDNVGGTDDMLTGAVLFRNPLLVGSNGNP
ncbi:hypothetical protein [Nitrosomonas sp.]|nr:hypothetical protein [Nitrosomonas sp.]